MPDAPFPSRGDANVVSEITRFTISLEDDLLQAFDRLCAEEHFATRSEAIRKLLREKLVVAAAEDDSQIVMASLTMVYDHHRPGLLEKLLELQHEQPDMVVSTMHVHVDHAHCMEVVVLRGEAKALRLFAGRLRGLKGIHQGQLVFAHASAGHDHGHGHHHHTDHE